jgi:hypothetical protein
MNGKSLPSTKKERSFQFLRSRFSRQQEDLELRLKDELKQVPADDLVAQVRVRHKYRMLGLNI